MEKCKWLLFLIGFLRADCTIGNLGINLTKDPKIRALKSYDKVKVTQ